MNDSVFVDTNVLVYLFDADSPEKQERERSWRSRVRVVASS
jgi:predicted nucleic acid-binding protein